MEISSSTTVSTARSNPDQARANLNYDAFLKLLIAQLKNQDPTEPQDPSQNLAQIAAFSSVEQSIKTNAKLDELISLSSVSQAATMIGRTIAAADGEVLGVISSILVEEGGSSAILDDGSKIRITAGMEIR